MISEDRGLIARTYGTLFLVGALIGGLILVIGQEGRSNEVMIATMALVAAVLGALCFIGYRQLPIWFFHLATALGTVMISVAAFDASDLIEGVFALFYVWVILLASLFFSLRAAAAHFAFAIIAFAIVLIDRDIQFTASYMSGMVAVLGTTGLIIVLLRSRVEQLAADLISAARTDALTTLANRRGFDERFDLELGRARRTGRPLSLMLFDLDRFKAVNDRLGHGEGDRALRRAALVIRESVRAIDSVGRLGGEEFGVLLPDVAGEEALEIGERIRIAVRDAFADDEVPLTASCGLATMARNEEGLPELMQSADSALYRAKKEGRDRTVVADLRDRVRPYEESRFPSSTK